MSSTWDLGWRMVLTCPHCKDEIWSVYYGDFVRCKCGVSFMDDTPEYARTNGTGTIQTRKVIDDPVPAHRYRRP